MVPPWQMPGAVPFNSVLAIGSRHALDDVVLAHRDLAFLQSTGGTTGAPKGAMLSHGNMVANVLQVAARIGRDLQDGVETLVIPLPLVHVSAMTGALAFFSKGARAVLVANPRDMPDFLKTLVRARPTAIIGVNTLFRALLDALEDVLALHPGVREAAAIGVDNARTGEAVQVLVVRSDARLGEAELLALCRMAQQRLLKAPCPPGWRVVCPTVCTGVAGRFRADRCLRAGAIIAQAAGFSALAHRAPPR